MKSMTGYAFVETDKNEMTVSIEIKSYNSRFLDLSINQPYWLSRLEIKVREFLSSRIQRGKVECTIRIKEAKSNLQVTADPDAAQAYLSAIRSVSQGIGSNDEVPLSLVIAQEGVLRAERVLDQETYWQRISEALIQAFDLFDKARIKEGHNLEKDILSMIERIRSSVSLIETCVPEMEKNFKDSIRQKFQDMLGNAVDEQRVLQETAALLVKYTINEELVRLRSHLDSIAHEFSENPAPGRKADFICQEINREINTIGSKNQLLAVGEAVIVCKDALENIREQLRNIE